MFTGIVTRHPLPLIDYPLRDRFPATGSRVYRTGPDMNLSVLPTFNIRCDISRRRLIQSRLLPLHRVAGSQRDTFKARFIDE